MDAKDVISVAILVVDKNIIIMEDLENALRLRRKYNAMPFKKFVKLTEDYIITLTQKDIDDFELTGLNNCDFFELYKKYNNYE